MAADSVQRIALDHNSGCRTNWTNKFNQFIYIKTWYDVL